MDNKETLFAAIEELHKLQSERGIENGWLYEIDPSASWPDDPRIGLVEGGPDVMLMRTVAPQLVILTRAYNDLTRWGTQIPSSIVELARAIVGENHETT